MLFVIFFFYTNTMQKTQHFPFSVSSIPEQMRHGLDRGVMFSGLLVTCRSKQFVNFVEGVTWLWHLLTKITVISQSMHRKAKNGYAAKLKADVASWLQIHGRFTWKPVILWSPKQQRIQNVFPLSIINIRKQAAGRRVFILSAITAHNLSSKM